MRILRLPVYNPVPDKFIHVRKAVIPLPDGWKMHKFLFYVKGNLKIDAPSCVVEQKFDPQSKVSFWQMGNVVYSTPLVVPLSDHLDGFNPQQLFCTPGIAYLLRNGAAMRVPDPESANLLSAVKGAYAAAEMLAAILLITESKEMLDLHLTCKVYFDDSLLLKEGWPKTISTVPARKWLKVFSDITERASKEFHKIKNAHKVGAETPI